MEVSLSKGIYSRSGPIDKKLVGTVNQVISKFKILYVGTSEGGYASIDKKSLQSIGSMKYDHCAISAMTSSNNKVYIITNRGTIWSNPVAESIQSQLEFKTGHADEVTSLAFPQGYRQVFASCS